MSRYRSTKYNEKVKIKRHSRGANVKPVNGGNTLPGGPVNSLRRPRISPMRLQQVPGGQMSVEYIIPFRGMDMTGSWESHISTMFTRLSRNNVPEEWIEENINMLNTIGREFFEWAIIAAQAGPNYGYVNPKAGGRGGMTLTLQEYMDTTGSQMRGCSSCPGLIGQCSSICTDIDIDTNIGGNNWDNPGDWKIKGGKITFHFALPW